MCDKVDAPNVSSYFKLPNWLRYKDATINQKNIDHRRFQHALGLTWLHKEIKNHTGQVSNIKLILNRNNWADTEYPTSINKNNYSVFEKNVPEIA